jgi:hypothetical protein
VSSLNLATRSSNNAPGFINVLYSVNGGPETLLATLTQPNTSFVDSALTFSPISVTSSFRIVLRPANDTSASGGTIDAWGIFQPVMLSGQVTTASPTALEPGSLALLLPVLGTMGLVVGMAARKRRRYARNSGAVLESLSSYEK